MLYRTCEYCGANLDPGEPCDCREEESAMDSQDRYETKKEEEHDDVGAEH